MKRVIVACVVTAMVAGAATATAGQLITGADIQDRSIRNRDIARGTISSSRLTQGLRRQLAQRQSSLSQSPGAAGQPGSNGSNGSNGAQGPQGPRGPQGARGLTPSAGNWGVINRNTIGSPDQSLRSGPFDPPNGDGSLNLAVRGNPEANIAGAPDQREKAAFGNEMDFTGDAVEDLDQLGFWVYTTGENTGRGTPNMPTISIEIDPNLTSTTSNFSTLTFLPAQSPSNAWSGYIDATTTPASPSGTGFTLTGAAGTETGCVLATPCTFAALQAALADGGDAATIGTIAVTKGRDYSWQGAVDALRIKDDIVDFEEHGVNVVDAP